MQNLQTHTATAKNKTTKKTTQHNTSTYLLDVLSELVHLMQGHTGTQTKHPGT